MIDPASTNTSARGSRATARTASAIPCSPTKAIVSTEIRSPRRLWRSASLTADETTSRVRLFHVSGAYRAEDAFVDLVTADRAVLPDGVIAIDSLFDPHAPHVSEAFYNFVASRPTAFMPIFIGANTVFLTRPDAVVQYEQHLTGLLNCVPLAIDWREWLGRRVLTAVRKPRRKSAGFTERVRRLFGR